MPEISDDLLTNIRKAYYTLEDLGSAQAIADHLGQMGIKGGRMSTDCPITNYVKATVPTGLWLGTHKCTAHGPTSGHIGFGVYTSTPEDGVFPDWMETLDYTRNLYAFVSLHDTHNHWGLRDDIAD